MFLHLYERKAVENDAFGSMPSDVTDKMRAHEVPSVRLSRQGSAAYASAIQETSSPEEMT